VPTPEEVRKRGGIARTRTKVLPDGTRLIVTVYRKKGPRGGRTTAHKAGVASGKTVKRRGVGS